MKSLRLFAFALLPLVCVLAVGCDSRPDPTENPEFSEEVYNDPGALKMEPMGKPGK